MKLPDFRALAQTFTIGGLLAVVTVVGWVGRVARWGR